MKTLGLIGKKLGHSFSKGYFSEKFEKGVWHLNYQYLNFELEHIEQVKSLFEMPELIGFNVTIPYKETIIPYLDRLSPSAASIGAVNTVKKEKDGKWCGYNTDVIGFEKGLDATLAKIGSFPIANALILGTGGAAKAIAWVLAKRGINYFYVSRKEQENSLTYNMLNAQFLAHIQLIINTTPLGMYPEVDSFPPLPYSDLNQQHFLYDLVYNPAQTQFLSKGAAAGAYTLNGQLMLIEQAEAAWEIWQSH